MNGRLQGAERLMADHLLQGCRLGDTAVVSTSVHLLQAVEGGRLCILGDVDAGQTFYQRRRGGEIVHIDVFHARARLPAAQVAGPLRGHLRRFAADPARWAAEGVQDAASADSQGPAVTLADVADGADAEALAEAMAGYIDIQTGRGGGRLSGSLTYGGRATLREAHENHVHMALLHPGPWTPLIVWLVDGVERALQQAGVELRRLAHVEHVESDEAPGTGSVDLSRYAAVTDSRLRGEGRRSGQSGKAGDVAMSRAVAMARRFDDVEEAVDLLDQIDRGKRRGLLRLPNVAGDRLNDILDEWERRRFIRRAEGDDDGYQLTEGARQARDYLTDRTQEVRLALKKGFRRLPASGRSRGESLSFTLGTEQGTTRRRAVPADDGEPLSDLAVPETVVDALKESLAVEEDPASRPPRLRIRRRHVHVYEHKVYQPVDICLLIDASASMAGQRIRAAKFLAQHLLLSTRDRVAVVAFQDREVQISVPFTRNYGEVNRGLAQLQPFGLTPMAAGMDRSLDYLAESRVNNPLLLLITDGIPTVPRGSGNPLEDTLEVARQCRQGSVAFTCVGLQPNQEYLQKLCATAGGTFHVVDELEEGLLVRIAHQERRRRRAALQGGG